MKSEKQNTMFSAHGPGLRLRATRESPCLRDVPPANLQIITSGTQSAAARRAAVWSIGVPLLGTACAIASWPWLGATSTTMLVFGVLFVLSAWGISIGLHRYFTHRSFQCTAAMERVLAILGASTFQGRIDTWVAQHRLHHRCADQPWDPHSPYWRGARPITSRFAGFIHAHIGWMFLGEVADPLRYAPEITPESVAGWASRQYTWICAGSLLVPGVAGWLLAGSSEGLRCLLWAGFARIALLHQLTWMVNSVCHMQGRRVEGSTDQSRDHPVLGFVLFGEGLHGTHHHHPAAAINGSLWADWNGAVITLLERLHLVWNVRRT